MDYSKTAEWDSVKRDLNNIFQESGGLQGDGMNAVGAYVKDNNLNYEWLLQGDEIKVKEKENMSEPVNILDSMDGSRYWWKSKWSSNFLVNNRAKGGRIGYENGELIEGEVIEEKSKGNGYVNGNSKSSFQINSSWSRYIFAAKDAYGYVSKFR